jgi:hypothetical protein
MVDESDHMIVKQLTSGGAQEGAGTTGRWSFFQAKTNATLGGWYNASKSYLDLDVTGKCTGLMSAHVMELRYPLTVPNQGHYTVGEFELVFQASTTVLNTSMAWFQASGDSTALAHFQDVGFLWEMTGFAEGDGNIVSMGTGGGAPTVAGTIRINVDGTERWLCLASKAAIN